MRFLVASLAFSVVALGITACSSTRVVKNPGPHDRGIRYYRPKPHLLVQPAVGGTDQYVSISLEYLPDYSEEYSIHIRSGVGANKTNVTLENGWNLTQLNVDVDSKTSENIKSVADLLEAGGKLRPTGPAQPGAGTVKATNVPMGYYESVVGAAPDGKKRLYGWRYVGFLPYAPCPVQTGGVECADCHTQDVYGLVFENGVMTFKPLASATVADTRRNSGTQDPSGAVSQKAAVEAATTKALLAEFKAKLMTDLDSSLYGVSAGTDTVTVTLNFDDTTKKSVAMKYQVSVEELKGLLGKKLGEAVNSPTHKVVVVYGS